MLSLGMVTMGGGGSLSKRSSHMMAFLSPSCWTRLFGPVSLHLTEPLKISGKAMSILDYLPGEFTMFSDMNWYLDIALEEY